MTEGKIQNIKVTLEDGQIIEVPIGTTIIELTKNYTKNFSLQILAAKVNNQIKELTYNLIEDSKIAFIDMLSDDGIRIYRRSLSLILMKASKELFPDKNVIISHSISKGVYCEIKGNNQLSEEDVLKLEQKMREVINKKIPFIKKTIPLEEAKEKFKKAGRMDKFSAIDYRKKSHVTFYECDGFEDYFYGYMVPNSEYINKFSLKFYAPGLIMLLPSKQDIDAIPEFIEQKKLFNIFTEYKKWGRILGVANLGNVNEIINNTGGADIIRVAEALQEKKIAQIADMITENSNKKKIVLIAGPSSSGKTTFANRLAIQLRVNGVRPVTISIDDYFVDRDSTPIDEDGDYDYEALEALDIKLFNNHMSELIAGKEVEIPIFNFVNGCRDDVGRKLKIDNDQLLIIEGIHGLNETLSSSIHKDSKFKIYVSALTSMNIDDHNTIATTDTRLIRRIVRDFQFRGNDAINTIKRWPSVRRGEEKNIFPFQEQADVMFNSSLVFELSALKVLAEPLLDKIDTSLEEYSEARRLIDFLGYFLPIEHKDIPANSIIREFLGGSCFYQIDK